MKKTLNDALRDSLIFLSIPVLLCCVGSCSGAASSATPLHDVAMSHEYLRDESSGPEADKQDVAHKDVVKDQGFPQTLKLSFFSEQPLAHSSVGQLVQQIESLSGVNAVAVSGVPHAVLEIKVDFARLEYYGTVKLQHMVDSLNITADMKDVSALVVGETRGTSIRLGDVAAIERGYASDNVSIWYNGTESASISVVPNKGISPDDIFKLIQNKAVLHPGEYFVRIDDTGYQIGFSIWTSTHIPPNRAISLLLERYGLHRYAPLLMTENQMKDAIDKMVEDRPVRVLGILRVPADKLADVRQQLASLFKAMRNIPLGDQPDDVDGIGSINIFLPESGNVAELQRDILHMLNSNEVFLASWTKTALPAKGIGVELEMDEERRMLKGVRNEDIEYYFDAVLNGIDGVTRVGGEEIPYHLQFDSQREALLDLMNIRVPAKDGGSVPLRDIAKLKIVQATTLNSASKSTELVTIVAPEHVSAAKKTIESWLFERNIEDARIETNVPEDR